MFSGPALTLEPLVAAVVPVIGGGVGVLCPPPGNWEGEGASEPTSSKWVCGRGRERRGGGGGGGEHRGGGEGGETGMGGRRRADAERCSSGLVSLCNDSSSG